MNYAFNFLEIFKNLKAEERAGGAFQDGFVSGKFPENFQGFMELLPDFSGSLGMTCGASGNAGTCALGHEGYSQG